MSNFVQAWTGWLNNIEGAIKGATCDSELGTGQIQMVVAIEDLKIGLEDREDEICEIGLPHALIEAFVAFKDMSDDEAHQLWADMKGL